MDIAAILGSLKLSSIYAETLEECRDTIFSAQKLHQLGKSDKDKAFKAISLMMEEYIGIVFFLSSSRLGC